MSLREMRDYVYGRRTSDDNWAFAESYWIKDCVWLRREFDKLKKPLPAHDQLPEPKRV